MLINFRGGLGNQIIQLSYVMNKSISPVVNTSAVSLRDQLKSVPKIKYINSFVLNIFMGSLRKILFFIRRKEKDIELFSLADGYFQYGDLTKMIPSELKSHLQNQIDFDESVHDVDIVLHVRGGDYLTPKAKKVYSNCSVDFYLKAVKYALNFIDKDVVKIYVVSNDDALANGIIKSVKEYTEDKDIVVNKYYKSEWSDFSLIYRAEICIIPNSTFSMSARLIKDGGVTIAPQEWFSAASKLLAPTSRNFIYLK